MITEITYSSSDLRKRCYNCFYLQLIENNDIIGECKCRDNKIKYRNRTVLDRKCLWKKEKVE
jgi:hypothetical protein